MCFYKKDQVAHTVPTWTVHDIMLWPGTDRMRSGEGTGSPSPQLSYQNELNCGHVIPRACRTPGVVPGLQWVLSKSWEHFLGRSNTRKAWGFDSKGRCHSFCWDVNFGGLPRRPVAFCNIWAAYISLFLESSMYHHNRTQGSHPLKENDDQLKKGCSETTLFFSLWP